MTFSVSYLLLTSALLSTIGCAPTDTDTVSGEWRLIGGQSACTDEDGDPESIQVAAFEAGSEVELHRFYFECSEFGFEIPLDPGTYDILVEAWQDLVLIDGLDGSQLFEDVVVTGSVDLGLITLDINDDD